MRTSNDNRGFSLIELMVVLVVFGLMVAATIPSTTRFARTGRLMGAARVLAADVHQARAIASMRRRSYEITFASGRYAIVRTSPRETLRVREMPYQVTMSATDTATFFPWGVTSPITVTLTGPGQTRTVQIRATGSVQL